MNVRCVPPLLFTRAAVTRLWAATLPLLVLGSSLTAPASAKPAPTGPEYSVSVVEGESTLPEEDIMHTSGAVRPKAPVQLSIVRAGTIIARSQGNENVWLSQVPEVGDDVTLESPIGTTVGSFIYDGLPTIAPTVCAGSTSFSGKRSPGQEIEGGYYTLVLKTNPYGQTSVHEGPAGRAQVPQQAGESFEGNFLAPLAIGETVMATESLATTLAGGAVFTYESETDRPVGLCPAPPPPPPPPPPAPALQGTVLALSHTTIRKLLKLGWSDQVTINQPGTVVQDLYLQGGKLPAYASARKGHGRTAAAVLLARGTATATSAGKVNVVLHLSAQGRRKLRHARTVHAVLLTTLVSHSGAKLALERHALTLHR
jgi:hypothetical protein